MADTHVGLTAGDAERLASGDVMAAVLAGGIGAFATGLVVLLNEAGVLAPPALYGPAGGVTGRTALATVLWLLSWAVLHYRWRSRRMPPGKIFALSMLLILLGMAGIFPPLWKLL